MNNVLIDDRRIKVDFSQSVAKLWNKRRRGERMQAIDNYSSWYCSNLLIYRKSKKSKRSKRSISKT